MTTVEDRLRAALTAKSDAVTLIDDRSLPDLGAGRTLDGTPVLLPAPLAARRSRGLVAGVLAVAAMLLLAVGAVALHRATATHRVEPAQIRPRSAIPWEKVGPGWTLVQESPRTAPAGDNTPEAAGDEQLQLIAPGGLRYRIASLGSRALVLVGWDGAHQRALLQSPGHEVPGQPHVTTDLAVLDLRSGTKRSFTIQDLPYGARLGGPGGQHIVLEASDHITAYTLTGRLEWRLEKSAGLGRTTDSRDGRQLIVGNAAGLRVYDYASGRLVRSLPAPTGYGRCYDPRWSGDGTLVAKCPKNGQDQLRTPMFAFSVDGVPAAGRADPRYRTVGDRVTGFQRGTVSTFYPLDDPAQPGAGSWPELTRMTAARLDSAGRTSPIGVPARFRAGPWMIANVTSDTFTVVRFLNPNPFLVSTAASWDPFTGHVTDLIEPSAPGAALIEVEPWGAQPY